MDSDNFTPDPNRPPQVLFTVAQLAFAEPALTSGAIRFDLFNRDSNGLAAAGAVVMRGRRLLIHRERYLEWMIARGQAA